MKIIPAFLAAIRTPSARSQEHNISQLAVLVWIVKQHIRNFLPEIFALISDLWASSPNVEIHIVALVESIARALNAEFKPYIPMVLPPMLKVAGLILAVMQSTDNVPSSSLMVRARRRDS